MIYELEVNIDGNFETKEFEMKFYNQYDQELVETVIEAVKNKTPAQLVKISHQQSPWKNHYQHDTSNLLPLESMYEYFRNK